MKSNRPLDYRLSRIGFPGRFCGEFTRAMSCGECRVALLRTPFGEFRVTPVYKASLPQKPASLVRGAGQTRLGPA